MINWWLVLIVLVFWIMTMAIVDQWINKALKQDVDIANIKAKNRRDEIIAIQISMEKIAKALKRIDL